nr:MAG TPA: hypothetical protein [Caudoviricetes sp.]DAS55864.1 MAG TPA: hypothetical protein [Caudoviricetes sp.]
MLLYKSKPLINGKNYHKKRAEKGQNLSKLHVFLK